MHRCGAAISSAVNSRGAGSTLGELEIGEGVGVELAFGDMVNPRKGPFLQGTLLAQGKVWYDGRGRLSVYASTYYVCIVERGGRGATGLPTTYPPDPSRCHGGGGHVREGRVGHNHRLGIDIARRCYQMRWFDPFVPGLFHAAVA